MPDLNAELLETALWIEERARALEQIVAQSNEMAIRLLLIEIAKLRGRASLIRLIANPSSD